MMRSRCGSIAILLLLVVGSSALSCAPGAGRDVVEIPSGWINDGYCDCPLDGSDESETAACSGSASGGWAGLSPRIGVANKDAEEDDKIVESGLLFACPKQPKLKIPASRTNDGICDCCDGADEMNNSAVDCPDDCEAVLAAERAARAKVINAYKIGSQKRQEGIDGYEKTVKETEEKLNALKNKAADLTSDKVVQELDAAKLKYWQTARRQAAQSIIDLPEMAELLGPLTDDELVAFVVHACQLSGEMDTPTSNDVDGNRIGSCAALRLAGMDYGITWSEENFDDTMAIQVSSEGNEGNGDLAEVVIKNLVRNEHEAMKWHVASSDANLGHRRLSEYDDGEDDLGADDYDDGYDDYDGDHYEDENYEEDDDYVSRYERSKHGRAKNNDGDKYNPSGKHEEAVRAIQATAFSKARVAFSTRAKEIVTKISEILDAADEENEDDEEEEDKEESAQSKEEESKENVDPAALGMVRSALQGREERIKRGYLFGASAKLLMGALQRTSPNAKQFRVEALAMASGTIYHGKLSSKHVWQVLQASIPELSVKLESSGDEHSCASPWANSCPPSSVIRDTGTVPPPFLQRVGESFCNEQVNEALQGLCANDSSDEIPSDVPEGFYGYNSAVPRASDDPLEAVFKAMESFASSDEQMATIKSLEGTRDDLNKQSSDIKREMKQLIKDVGGKSEERKNKFGPDGELFALKDECHSVTAGKYIYEVCIFGNARQKDRDGGSSGTSLGHWDGMEVNDSGRIMKWTNGQSCWNGPKRSATVHVTCGAEHKVLSADEPDTCRYVMEMESPIACDDAYKQQHSL